MSCQTIRTPETRAKFLSLLSEIGNVTQAAAGTGIGRASVYEWRDDDAAFARDWDQARRLGAEGLEDIARARAAAGSDLLLMFLLKGAMPDRYRERSTIDVNQSVTIDLKRLPREELLRRLDELRREQDAEPLMIEGSTVHD
jgi:hypothetical protein